MKYEPVFFFQEILSEDRPLTDLIDADFATSTEGSLATTRSKENFGNNLNEWKSLRILTRWA